MGYSETWKKTPRNRKACTFVVLGFATVVAFILALGLTTKNIVEGNVGQGTVFEECDAFFPAISTNLANFSFGGVNCGRCQKIGTEIAFSGCDNDCSQWVYEISSGDFVPVSATCDVNFAPTPQPPPGSDIVCPEGFYQTEQQTGCDGDSLEAIIALSKACLFLEEDPTLSECFAACENPQSFCETCDIDTKCGGVIIAADGQSCFVFLEEAEPFCGKEKEGQVTCKPIPPNFQCFDDAILFADAEAECARRVGGSLVQRPNPDEENIQLARITQACLDAETAEGCYFGSDSEECFFIQPDGDLDQDPDCNDQRGFCCEIPTDAPTASPTAAPTNTLFFVPDCGEGVPEELTFQEARDCCLANDADLATIDSEEEQDFAYAKCAEALNEFENDCGCWIGLNRIDQPVSVDRDDFTWIDGAPNLFENFEDFPLFQPNNLDDRNEECVHMRPFTLGGWNDLPCLGNCDARDTKPFPLCRAFTPAPTASPTQNPTVSPTKNPTVSPTVSPTKNPTTSPTKNPTTSPTQNPTTSPTKNPTTSPTKNPTTSPTKNPTTSPTKNPTTSPTQNPTTSPTKNPTVSPTKNPTTSPTKNPTTSPTQNPTTSPTQNPTTSPTKNPTVSPTKNPTVSPTVSPTKNPTVSPTVSPTKNPTQNPTTSPTTSPTKNPTTSPTQNPTKNPTTSPTKNPTNSPTDTPTVSPTKNPTTSPTVSPTKNPTTSPTTSPTKNPTTSPTRNPTTSPTKNPTTSPTKNPTTSPTQNPTTSPTRNPTVSPTKNPTTSPTVSPTKNPTTSPTQNPTVSPTQNPTTSPTKNPTVSPTKNPTTSPTQNPTVSPTQNPTTSPTKNPTVSPTKNPTLSPTTSPTTSPTKNPTTSPTQNPTNSPTTSPITPPDAPVPVCQYGDGEEFIFRFFNSRTDVPVFFRYSFAKPGSGPLAGDPDFYPTCFFSTCFSFTFEVGPGEVFEFNSPAGTINVEFPCLQDPNEFCPAETVVAPDDLIQCLCEHFEFFADDFEEYPGTEAISIDQSPEFFEKWNVLGGGTVDIKGIETDENGDDIFINGEPKFVSDFFFNVCNGGTKCVDIDGTVTRRFLEEVEQAIRPIDIPPADAFFNRICTLNFFTRGNGRCGSLHRDEDPPIVNSGQAQLNDRCFQFYRNEPVPLEDNLTFAIQENGAELVEVVFEAIRWDTPFFPAGLTADVSNDATEISASFTVFGGIFLETGENIGPLLDDVDLTCCCPDPDDRYVNRVLEFIQGKTGSGDDVPLFRSDPTILIDREPSYINKRVVSLGLLGEILIEFGLGATGYIYIYKEFFGCCCCQDFFDPDDARVEVSVDGVNFIPVLDSFQGLDFDVLPGGDNSIRRFRVDLPNGACFKYVRIIDTSEKDNAACDGFDLVAVEVKKPCCPTISDPFVTNAPAEAPVQSAFGFGGELSGASAVLAIVGIVGLVALATLTVLTVRQHGDAEEAEEPEMKDVELSEEIMPSKEDEAEMTKEEAKDQL